MQTFAKQFTEPIFDRLANYRTELERHPFLAAAREDKLPEDVLIEFAFLQFADSILWIPMLAQMKSKATRSARLARAIGDNIGHEAGLEGTSHVTLAVRLMRSLGARSLEGMPTHVLERSAALWISDAFERFSEPEIAGWLLGAETLVPVMFAAVLPAFERLGCDATYFSEHVAVDGDEHAAWMREAVLDVVGLHGESAVADVMSGMADAFEETLEVPEDLRRRRCASH